MQRVMSALEVVQAGAVLAGCNPPAALDVGSSAEATLANQVYESMVGAELSAMKWNFATRQLVLSRQADVPDSGYSAMYLIPPEANATSVESVHVNDTPIDYDIFENMVHCDAGDTATVVLIYQARVEEQYWPPFFAMAMIYRMTSMFAFSIARQADVGSSYAEMAEVWFRKARSRDSQQVTATGLRLNRFSAARRGRGHLTQSV